jgi:hypothetical protein
MSAFLFSLKLGLSIGLIVLVGLTVTLFLGTVVLQLGLLILPYLGPGWTIFTLYGLLIAAASYLTKKHHRIVKPK